MNTICVSLANVKFNISMHINTILDHNKNISWNNIVKLPYHSRWHHSRWWWHSRWWRHSWWWWHTLIILRRSPGPTWMRWTIVWIKWRAAKGWWSSHSRRWWPSHSWRWWSPHAWRWRPSHPRGRWTTESSWWTSWSWWSPKGRRPSTTTKNTMINNKDSPGYDKITLTEHLSSPPVFSGIRVTRSSVLCVCFVDRCLSFCTRAILKPLAPTHPTLKITRKRGCWFFSIQYEMKYIQRIQWTLNFLFLLIDIPCVYRNESVDLLVVSTHQTAA